jgi:thiopurine S-methyltransferase
MGGLSVASLRKGTYFVRVGIDGGSRGSSKDALRAQDAGHPQQQLRQQRQRYQEWDERWREGRIGFHQATTNPQLDRYLPRMPPTGRVLVPLAGKSRDMTYLASKGYGVVGIEFVPEACAAFFVEQAIPYAVEGCAYAGGGVRILAADIFDVTPAEIGEIAWTFDRAALIALPPELRPSYVEQLARLSGGAPILLVGVDYDPTRAPGPPYAVPIAEVERLFTGARIEKLEEAEVLDQNPRFRERGLDWLVEYAFVIRRRE